MIESLIAILIVALVLFVLYWLVGKFVTGLPLQIVGIVLGLILLLYALKRLGLINSIGF